MLGAGGGGGGGGGGVEPWGTDVLLPEPGLPLPFSDIAEAGYA